MSQKGFTLIESMTVIAIIAIIASFAYSSYREYTHKAKVAEIKQRMIEASANLASWRTLNKNSDFNASLSSIVLNNRGLLDNGNGYTIALTVEATLKTGAGVVDNWLLKATPQGTTASMDSGDYKLNHLGQKCHTKNVASCSLSSSSNWD